MLLLFCTFICCFCCNIIVCVQCVCVLNKDISLFSLLSKDFLFTCTKDSHTH